MSEQVEQSKYLQEFNKKLKTKELKEYINIRKTTNSLTDESLKTIQSDEYQAKQFMADYNTWVKADKPVPQMPNLSQSVVPVPIRLVRLADRGQDKIYVMFSDGHIEGIEEKISYVMEKNQKTGLEESTGIVNGKTPIYTKKFSKESVLSYIKEAEDMLPPERQLSFYIKQYNNVYDCNQLNFLKSWDELNNLIAESKPLV